MRYQPFLKNLLLDILKYVTKWVILSPLASLRAEIAQA